ncbi:MAG: hypothetical protein KAI24_08845, partial [Planctomycetes bacterium]|nr:hypothetical protein [Planctomycetota bacterium]
RVEDPAGRPCAGVPIALTALHGVEADLGGSAFARTGADGTAVIEHLQRAGEWLEHDSSKPEAYGVHILLPGVDAAPFVFASLTDPPQQPVVLRMPHHGRAEVRIADAFGGSRLRVPLGVECDDSDDSAWTSAEPGPDGVARFDYLPLGRTFVLHCDALVDPRTFEGPTSPGQTVAVTFGPRPDHVYLWLRLVGRDGQPIADRTLRFRHRKSRGQRTVNTGPDGRLLVRMTDGEGGRTEAGEFTIDGGPTDGRATLDVPALGPGVHDLGDVVVAAPRALCGGTLRARGRLFLGPASGDLFVRGPAGEAWQRLDATTTILEAGRFTTYGQPDADFDIDDGRSYRLQFESIEAL